MKRLDEEMVRDPPRDPRRFGSRPRRDLRRTGPRPRRDRDVGNFGRDETETRRWYVSRPSRDRDVETETTSLECRNGAYLFRTVWSYDKEDITRLFSYRHLYQALGRQQPSATSWTIIDAQTWYMGRYENGRVITSKHSISQQIHLSPEQESRDLKKHISQISSLQFSASPAPLFV